MIIICILTIAVGVMTLPGGIALIALGGLGLSLTGRGTFGSMSDVLKLDGCGFVMLLVIFFIMAMALTDGKSLETVTYQIEKINVSQGWDDRGASIQKSRDAWEAAGDAWSQPKVWEQRNSSGYDPYTAETDWRKQQ